ncbi:MAG TPA: hypothetical protein VJ925_04460 [Longimicrobiales bacterium]|nr:hypothetical protein [Longimicrobiales bacterium]
MEKYGMMMAGGVLTLLAFKLFAAFVLPALAVVFGLVMTVAKFALIAAVIYFVFTMFRRRSSKSAEA